MRCDMVSLCAGSSTVCPLASETEVVGALTTNVVVAEMEIKKLSVWSDDATVCPLASLTFTNVIHSGELSRGKRGGREREKSKSGGREGGRWKMKGGDASTSLAKKSKYSIARVNSLKVQNEWGRPMLLGAVQGEKIQRHRLP